MKNTITKENEKAINRFFSKHKEKTAKELSKFLFDVQGSYLTPQGISLTDDYAADVIANFVLLFHLVTELQPVKE